MEFYSDSKPNLIGPTMKKIASKIIKMPSQNSTISDKVSNMITIFYNDYIQNNLLITFITLVFIVFLIYSYYAHQKNKKPKENFRNEEQKIINEIMKEQTEHVMISEQPSVDRLHSVKPQETEKVNYPPEPIPINIPGKGFIAAQNIYPDPIHFETLNTPNYDYNNVYTNPSRSYYNGTYNTYNGPQDTNIYNPLGFPTDFNSTTGKFVKEMTDANTFNILNYQSILDNAQDNMVNGMRYGPKGIYDVDIMDPPFATD